MKFRTIDTLERIAEAVRNSDERALEKVLEDVNAARKLSSNWPFDFHALQLLLVTLLKQFFDHDVAKELHLTATEFNEDDFKQAFKNISYETPAGGFQFNVAVLLADLAAMAWKKSISGMRRLVLEMEAAKSMVRGEYTEPVEPFIHVAEAVIEVLERKQA